MISNWIEVLRTCNLSPEKKMDPVSKWLIITRACVFSMTLISAGIGAMLAALAKNFSLGVFLLVALGLTLAHAANNMVNDLFDYWQGTDTPDYPRANYAPHPILGGLVSIPGLIAAILICNLADLAIAIYLYTLRGLPILYFAVAGLLTSVFYVAPPLKLKYRGFGELAIFVIWGPLMIAGTYFALAGSAPLSVWVNSVPYGLAVTAVLMGKHLDKQEKDRAKGVRTLPVALGDRRARLLTQLMILAFYLATAVLAGHGDLPWPTLLVIISLPKAVRINSILSLPAPATPKEAFALAEEVIPPDLKAKFDPDAPPESYPLWPLWYVAWGVWWVRTAGGLLVGGLLLGLLI
jgi:1,4-dihydroxy-2-naphthoate polyprenyltransferase